MPDNTYTHTHFLSAPSPKLRFPNVILRLGACSRPHIQLCQNLSKTGRDFGKAMLLIRYAMTVLRPMRCCLFLFCVRCFSKHSSHYACPGIMCVSRATATVGPVSLLSAQSPCCLSGCLLSGCLSGPAHSCMSLCTSGPGCAT